MKRFLRFIDPFIVGGFVGSLFAGLITPHQLKLIVSALDVRVLTLGSLAASLFPLMTGLAFEQRRLVRRMYAALPVVMGAEVALTAASILFQSLNLSLYYIASMLIFGVVTSTVMYLLQIMKQRRYRRQRAAFDRRYTMADASGYLAGSLLALGNWPALGNIRVLLALGLLQTVLVYLLYLRCYRRRKGGVVDKRSRAPS